MHNGKPVTPENAEGLERLAQYFIRNPFSEQRLVYNADNGPVIYRYRMHNKGNRNFGIFEAEDFIASIPIISPKKKMRNECVRKSIKTPQAKCHEYA